MSLSEGQPRPAVLERIVVVLWETQDRVNIAGTIRAMKNFGLSRVRLVSPAEWDPWRIEGIAHDTGTWSPPPSSTTRCPRRSRTAPSSSA
jgi:hypothetical protein